MTIRDALNKLIYQMVGKPATKNTAGALINELATDLQEDGLNGYYTAVETDSKINEQIDYAFQELCVNLEFSQEGESFGKYVADKTFGEIYRAVTNGKPIVFHTTGIDNSIRIYTVNYVINYGENNAYYGIAITRNALESTNYPLSVLQASSGNQTTEDGANIYPWFGSPQ